MSDARPSGASRASTLALGLWCGAAGLAMLLARPAPDPPPYTAEEAAVWQRQADWAVRDARLWQAEHGDLRIPWDRAAGHLAILIDDVGRELHVLEQLRDLRFVLGFSVLPGSVYAPGVQLRLMTDERRPREVFLHLPMEPLEPERMREGADAREEFLLGSDGPDELRAKLDRALVRVPSAIGVNNHMGSRLSADRRAMDRVMSVLSARGLIFVDSRTTADTVAEDAARAAGLVVGRREVFLDDDPAKPAITSALRAAAEAARRHPVLAIGHPSVELLEVLREQLPALHASGVGIFPVSELIVRAASEPPAPPAAPGEGARP